MKMKMMVILMMVIGFNAFSMDESVLWGASGEGVATFILQEDDGSMTMYSFGSASEGIWYKGVILTFTSSKKLETQSPIVWYTHQGDIVIKVVSITVFDEEGNELITQTSGQVYRMSAAIRYVGEYVVLLMDGEQLLLFN